jgi:hypothetical protein
MPNDSPPNPIQVDSLKKSSGSKRVLDGIGFEVPRGETLAVTKAVSIRIDESSGSGTPKCYPNERTGRRAYIGPGTYAIGRRAPAL